MNRLCTLCALALLLQCTWFVIEVYGKNFSSYAMCRTYANTGVTLGLINKLIIYTVLWIRQFSFQKSSEAAKLESNAMLGISYGTLAGIVILCATQEVAFVMRPVKITESRCHVEEGPPVLYHLIRISYVAFTLCQISLLVLVLLPVFRHLRKKTRDNSRMRNMVIRLSVCTVVCVVSDLLPLVVAVSKLGDLVAGYVSFFFAFNCIVNIISLFASFSDYSQRLAPFYFHIKDGMAP